MDHLLSCWFQLGRVGSAVPVVHATLSPVVTILPLSAQREEEKSLLGPRLDRSISSAADIV